MRNLKKISIWLIVSLAVFACVEKGYVPFSAHHLYGIENTAHDEKPGNSITPHSDLPEMDEILTKSMYSFNVKDLSGKKITIADSIFPHNIYFCIWQPPKIFWI